MTSWFLTAALCVSFVPALAEEGILPLRKVLNAQAQYLATLPSRPPSPTCEARYRRLWRDGALQVDWFYGYLDSEGMVVDRLFSQETRKFLMRPCRQGLQGACGFKMTADQSAESGPVTLQRRLPSGHTITLRVWYSSLTDWEAQNSVGLGRLSVMNRAQQIKTQKLWQTFTHSLQTREAVIYSGHSRIGTGPGFSPFSILQTVGGTLFKYNLEKTRYALQTAKKKPEVLMISSCESEKYYLSALHKAAPTTAMAMTQYEQSFGAGEQTAVALIDSLVVGRCGEELNQALASTNGPHDGGMRMWGFQ